MAITPGTYDISLQRRADYSITLQFKDSTGAAVNLTGWTAAAQIWNQERTTKHADFAIIYVDRLTGTIAISLTNNQTATLPSRSYYDVLLINPSGQREYYLEGIVSASEGYTS